MLGFVKKRFYILVSALVLVIVLSALLVGVSVSAHTNILVSESGVISDVDGDGVYEISTKEELIVFCELVNGGAADINARLVSNIYFNGDKRVLDGKSGVADASGLTEWTPIGSTSGAFSGSFDGMGHTVNGLYCDLRTEKGSYVGLFGCVSEDGEIKNVLVENSYFGAEQYVGGIAGYCEGSIVNCMTSAVIEATSDSSCYAGGIVGYTKGGSVKNCLSVLKVSGRGKNIGGIAGASIGESFIINSHNMADVLGKTNVGGVVGLLNNSSIKTCYYLEGCAIANAGEADQVEQSGVGNSDDAEGTTIKTGISDNAFESGRIAYLLQAAQKIDREGIEYQLWGQRLAENEEHPTFSKSKVYRVGSCDAARFDNDVSEFSHLSVIDGICSSCGECEEGIAVTTDNYFSLGLGWEHIGSYAIGSKGALYWFTEKFEYHSDTDISAVLTANITLYEDLLDGSGALHSDQSSMVSWTPIAGDKGYTGVFDGNGYEISGIYCLADTTDAGLFGIIEKGGAVKHLGIVDSYFVLKKGTDAGSIAGENRGEVINCYTKATICNDGSYNYKGNVGGIVGTNSGKVLRCYNAGVIYESDNNSSSLGGVVGKNGTDASVEICYNLGKIYSNTTSSRAVGGVVGYSNGTVRYSFNCGDITSYGEVFYEDTDASAGGVVGILDECGKVTRCYNEGSVTSTLQSAGGLVGHLKGGVIDNCYNAGEICGGKYSAGLAGYVSLSAGISNCYNIGKVDCDNDGVSKNTISNPMLRGDIENCYYVYLDIANDRATEVSAEKLKNGELLGLLGSTEIWKQGDSYPEIIFDNILLDSIELNIITPPSAQRVPQSAVIGENWRGEIVWNCTTGVFDWYTAYTATVIITPDENYKLPTGLSCLGWQISPNGDGSATATKTFPRTEKRKITEIVGIPGDVALTEHKASAAEVIAMLPVSVGVCLEADGYEDVCIVWSCAEHTVTPNATNIFEWSLDSEVASVYDANGLATGGSISVTNPAPIAVEHTEIDTSVSYNVGTYDVSQLFVLDANAGEAVYSIAEGGNGSGTLNGSVLTISSSGTIKIKLYTEPNGIYASGEALAFLTVNKGIPDIPSTGVLGAYYGQTLGEVELPTDEKGSWRWDESASTPVGDVGVRTHKAIFMPYDSKNYENAEAYITVNVEKKVVPYPVIADKIYNGSRQTADVLSNEYYTVEENRGGISAGEYDVVLALRDPRNHKWAGSENKSVTLKFNITKAQNEWLTRPYIDGWTYGSAPSEPQAKAKFGEVGVKYRTYGSIDQYVSVLPTNAGIYEAHFYVEASENYGALSFSLQFVVERVALTVSADNASKRCGDADPVLAWKITSGSLVGTDVLYIAISRTAGEAAGQYEISVTHGAGGNPNYRITFVGATFTIEGEASDIEAPSGLVARYGDTLADVVLPEGFVWKLPLTTSVGDVGVNSFEVTYIPQSIDMTVTVDVSRATQIIAVDLTDRTACCGDILDARSVSAQGKITYSSSDSDIASVDTESGRITVHKAGEVTITLRAGQTDNYLAAAVSYRLVAVHGYGEWISDESAHWRECVCGAKSGAAAHTVLAEESKCSVCRRPFEPTHEHSYSTEWKYSLTEHWRECECGARAGSSEHILTEAPSDLTKAYDADCLSVAVYFKSCSVCGHISGETFEYGDALGHDFAEYTSDGNATCTDDGTRTSKCIRCDVTDIRSDEGSRLGHDFAEYTSDGNATCTDDGTKTSKCTRCDASDTRSETSSALGHSFGSYVSDNNATCTDDGTKTSKCIRCDVTDIRADEGSRLGHDFAEYTSDGNATCTDDGTKTSKCTRCDATDTKTDEGSLMEHDYVGGVCAVCGSSDENYTDTTTIVSTDTESGISTESNTDGDTADDSTSLESTDVGSGSESLAGSQTSTDKSEKDSDNTVVLVLAFAAVFAMGVGVSALIMKKKG